MDGVRQFILFYGKWHSEEGRAAEEEALLIPLVGRTAHTVRRVGRALALPDPYRLLNSSAAHKLIIFAVMPNPEPHNILAIFEATAR